MSTSAGALIRPELSAKIYWTLGRGVGATAEEAVTLGNALIEEIQQELTATYRRGAENARRVQTVEVTGVNNVGASSYAEGGSIV